MFLIAVAQIVAGSALYRARAVNGWTAGDWLILYFAPAVGFTSNVLLFRVPSIARKYGVTTRERAVEASFVVTFIAFCATLLVSLNLFGS
jgi:hypothetical protein